MMKLYLKFAVLLAVTAFVTAKDPVAWYMVQKLDYFNTSETRSWLMRYLANDELYQPGGPLFIYVGGREPISASNIRNGSQIYRLAEEHHGYLFHFQHRFYDDWVRLNMSDEYLKYLDTRHALADLARFITVLKHLYGKGNSKVILVGCCTGGALATWLKKLYPSLVNGVWASSAHLYAKIDLVESKVLAGEAIRKVGGDACYNRIKGGFAELEEMIENKRGAGIKEMFRLCDSFNVTNNLDVSTLYYEISQLFFNLITYEEVERVKAECTRLVERSQSDLLGLAYYAAEKLGGDECHDLTYNPNLSQYKSTVAYRNIMRQWTYQRCNEFGGFKTSSSPSQIFGSKLPLEFFVRLCADLFGDKFTKEYIESRVDKTNKRYGGLNPEVENVYWTNGELDPYRFLSIQTGPHVRNLPNISHCADMHASTYEDSPELMVSEQRLEMYVRQWLA